MLWYINFCTIEMTFTIKSLKGCQAKCVHTCKVMIWHLLMLQNNLLSLLFNVYSLDTGILLAFLLSQTVCVCFTLLYFSLELLFG